MYKAAIFDLDGTLADTIKTIKYFGDMALFQYGLAPISEDKYKYMVGNGAKVLLERMLEESGKSDVPFDEIYKFYNGEYDKNPLYLTKVYDGILDMLKALKEKSFKLGVLSNKPDFAARSVVASLFGDDFFDTVRGQIDSVPKKPAPDGVYKIIDEWGIEKEKIIYVGDTGVDVKTGKSAGLFTIGVLWGFREREELADADLIIEKPSEILKLIVL